ncbi:MAG: hypothetical protein U0836_07945 [Pirellulales bacterium]
MSLRSAQRRFGFSMVELLMALALTLLMMGAVVTIFGLINASMTDSRATVELNGRLQAAGDRLQRDLDGLTVPVIPWARPDAGLGYFEYVEGPRHDFDAPMYPREVKRDASEQDWKTSPLPLVGDIDDVLMFTTRSRGQPFVGQIDPPPGAPPQPNPQILQSDVAEVIYFCAPSQDSWDVAKQFTELPPSRTLAERRANEQRREVLYTLYRQVRLVYPSSKAFDGAVITRPSLDLSYRWETVNGSPRVMLNSLGDLTKRENRAFRVLKGFPFSVDRAFVSSMLPQPDFWSFHPNHPRALPNGPPLDTGPRWGRDVVLTNVLAFDVKAWDPTASVLASNANSNSENNQGGQGFVVYQPGEPNYDLNKLTQVSTGAYVDLNYARRYRNAVPPSTFSGPPNPLCQQTFPAFYDTWSLHYEFDGLDQDGKAGPDQASNGMDDNLGDPSNGGVDDASERETSPPYPVPLRGIQVRIRVYEPDSRQVRQVTINGDFLPE